MTHELDPRKAADNVIDALSRISELADLAEAKRVADATDSLRCGNCFWWMKSSQCPREKNVNGYSQGPSNNSPACSKFKITDRVVALKAERLAEVEKRLAALEASGE